MGGWKGEKGRFQDKKRRRFGEDKENILVALPRPLGSQASFRALDVSSRPTVYQAGCFKVIKWLDQTPIEIQASC